MGNDIDWSYRSFSSWIMSQIYSLTKNKYYKYENVLFYFSFINQPTDQHAFHITAWYSVERRMTSGSFYAWNKLKQVNNSKSQSTQTPSRSITFVKFKNLNIYLVGEIYDICIFVHLKDARMKVPGTLCKQALRGNTFKRYIESHRVPARQIYFPLKCTALFALLEGGFGWVLFV